MAKGTPFSFVFYVLTVSVLVLCGLALPLAPLTLTGAENVNVFQLSCLLETRGYILLSKKSFTFMIFIRGITAYHISLYPPSPPRLSAVLRRACGGGGTRSFDRQMSSEKVMPDGYKQAGVHIASIGGRAG